MLRKTILAAECAFFKFSICIILIKDAKRLGGVMGHRQILFRKYILHSFWRANLFYQEINKWTKTNFLSLEPLKLFLVLFNPFCIMSSYINKTLALLLLIAPQGHPPRKTKTSTSTYDKSLAVLYCKGLKSNLLDILPE